MGKRVNTAKWYPKQNRWQIKVQKDGERRTFTSSTPGRTGQREANAKADAWLDEGIDNLSIRAENLLKDYLEDIKARTGTGNYRNEEYRVRVWISPWIGHLKIHRVTEQKLQEIINDAYQQGLSKKSLSSLKGTISAFFKFCRKCKVSTLFPENLTIPHGAHQMEKKILQPQHLITLFTEDTTMYRGKRIKDPYINAYRFAVLTGLRPGELVGLMPGDISGRFVTVRRSINVMGEVTAGKNDNSRRSFLLTETALQVLNAQLEQCKALYIFNVESERHYRLRWKQYCKSNGIPYIPPYNLRHTFVSMAKTLPEGIVKGIVGHSRNMDTFGTYGHALKGDQDKTAILLEGIFQNLLSNSENEVG